MMSLLSFGYSLAQKPMYGIIGRGGFPGVCSHLGHHRTRGQSSLFSPWVLLFKVPCNSVYHNETTGVDREQLSVRTQKCTEKQVQDPTVDLIIYAQKLELTKKKVSVHLECPTRDNLFQLGFLFISFVSFIVYWYLLLGVSLLLDLSLAEGC